MTEPRDECSFHFSLHGISLPDSEKERIWNAMQKTMFLELAKVDLLGDRFRQPLFRSTLGVPAKNASPKK